MSDKTCRSLMIRHWLTIVAVWTLVPFLLFMGCELGLRVLGYGRSFAPFRTVDTDRGRIYIANFDYLYELFTEMPNTLQSDVEFVIPEAKEPGTYRIFVFGSSAAFGWTHSCSFAQMLQVMLMWRYPGVRFEVFNLANGGLNSSIMRPLARICATMNPDAYIIYMGNNEVHGPYGLVSEFQTRKGRVPTWVEIRFQQSLRRLRLGQLFYQTSKKLTHLNLKKRLSDTLRPDDPRLSQVWRNYEYNLRDMFTSAADAGATVFVSTLGANLRHWAPDTSLVWDDITEEVRTKFATLISEGQSYETAGQWYQAIEVYRRAASITESSPYLFFRQANCLWALNEYDRAREFYEKALELDSFVWVRAKQAVNDTIKRAVHRYSGSNVILVDGQGAFQNAAPHGVPGHESFVDGCHFRAEGSYVLAKAFFESMQPAMPDWVKGHEDHNAPLPTLSDIGDLFGFTMQLRENILKNLINKSREFGMDNAVTLQAELEAIRRTPATIDYAKQFRLLRQVIESGTENIVLAYKFIECLGSLPGSVDAEVLQLLKKLADRYPFDRRFQHEYANLLMFHEDKDIVREQLFSRVLSVYPTDALSYLSLSRIFRERGACDEFQSLILHSRQNGVAESVRLCVEADWLFCQVDPACIQAYMAVLSQDSAAYIFALEGLKQSTQLLRHEALKYAQDIKDLVQRLIECRQDYRLSEVLQFLPPDEETVHLYSRIVLEESKITPLNLKILDEAFNNWFFQNIGLEFWRRFAEEHPDLLLSWIFLGMAYEQEGQFDMACYAYDKAFTQVPNNSFVLHKLGLWETIHGEIETGLAYLDKALETNQSEAHQIALSYFELGNHFKRIRSYAIAIEFYRRAYELSPSNLWSQVGIGECYAALGDYAVAEKEYQEVLTKAPESPITAGLLDALCEQWAQPLLPEITCEAQVGILTPRYLRTDKLNDCLVFWRNLCEMHPHAVIPLLYRGITEERLNHNEEARNTYLIILGMKQNYVPAFLRLGSLELRCGNIEQAIEHFKKAVAVDRNVAGESAKYCTDFAACFSDLGDKATAIRLYKAALEISPDDLWPQVYLGELYEKQGKYETALETYRDILIKKPESPISAKKFHNLLSCIGMGSESIIQEWKTIADSSPWAAVPNYYLAMALEAIGSHADAEHFFKRAREINPQIDAVVRNPEKVDNNGGKQ